MVDLKVTTSTKLQKQVELVESESQIVRLVINIMKVFKVLILL